jgi:hypothetical protein
VEQDGDKTHVSKMLVMTQECTAHTLHFVAAIVAEFSLGVVMLYGLHQMGGMEVATGFTYDEKILHGK